MLALIVARHGTLAAGAPEAAAECGGRVLVAGDGPVDESALSAALGGVATLVDVVDLGPFVPHRWAPALAALVHGAEVVVLPASSDGRDLAPRLAFERDCPLHANAIRITESTVDVVCDGGLSIRSQAIAAACVATLQPGVRSVERRQAAFEHRLLPPADVEQAPCAGSVTPVELLDADPATVDLAEAPRIVSGGAGLDSPERFVQLAAVAGALDASVGTTRVVTDRGWLPYQRQIGTTGVVVSPELYVAFGLSGAVQHTSGIGSPRHIVSVNTDAHCPMMRRADVAIVADANAVIDHLDAALAAQGGQRGQHG